MFDASLYNITIEKKIIEEGDLHVATVLELPDLESYGASSEEAESLVLDAIETSYYFCLEEGIPFPEPELTTVSNPFLSSHEDKALAEEKCKAVELALQSFYS